MDQTTIDQLNQINADFYNRVGASFDATRSYNRSGWFTILERFQAHAAGMAAYHVLDVGCGNGQFGKFLAGHLDTPLCYHGIDTNAYLLAQARDNLPSGDFTRLDFVADLDALRQVEGRYHAVVLNNVLHHVPAFARRRDLLLACAAKLRPGGWLVFTLWQFFTKEKWRARIVSWETRPHIDRAQLEPHDYLLDWRKGEQAVRYCHFTGDDECSALCEALAAGRTSIAETFLADGKTGDLNRYVIAQGA
jgi:2-polyprenyl-3-methyl-5-hydroxy-6-metoxy-1,4-benzoquinol methylase